MRDAEAVIFGFAVGEGEKLPASQDSGVEPSGCCGATVCVNVPFVGPVCHCAGVESPMCP
jgi:hypothetical protein